MDAFVDLLYHFTQRAGDERLDHWLYKYGTLVENGHSVPSTQEIKTFELFAARARTCLKYEPEVALTMCLHVLATLVLTTLHKESPYLAQRQRRTLDLVAALQNAQELHSYHELAYSC